MDRQKTHSSKPELLAPAGDMERLDMALHYGADAVYLAGKSFGMRASAGNFDENGLREAGERCRAHGAKMYVTVNTLPHEGELAALPGFLRSARDAGADAFIAADLGVMALAKRYAPEVPLHVSTQLGVVNSAAANMLYELGAKRVVLARETSLAEIREIRSKIPDDLEIEAFVHGAMCVSFSGRCLLSNYMTGRDANSGACAQPCRWKYRLVEEKRPGEFFDISEDEGGTYILNSNDLCMIEHIPELADAGVSALKIEGRMKSAYYAAIVTYAYRGAIDDFHAGRPFDKAWLEECGKVSHRRYSTGFYFGDPGQCCRAGGAMYSSEADVCAVVEDCGENGDAVLTQRNKLVLGDTLELVRRGEKPIRFTLSKMQNGDGEEITSAPHPMMTLRMRLPAPAQRLSIVRKLK